MVDVNNSYNLSFSSAQIELHANDAQQWHEFVRAEEFRKVMLKLGALKFDNGLELGAGDGGQSVTIAKYCSNLVCTEYIQEGNIGFSGRFKAFDLPNVRYEICDATDLSRFPDSSFDFVFSSNMLEHILDWNKCLKECKRVLTRNGTMIHIMPSRTWKLWNSIITLTIKRSRPPIHGIEKTHLAEWAAFGEKSWISKIESVDLSVDSLFRMPFYFGYGPIALPIIKLGNCLGWPSSTAYVIRKME